MKNILSAIVLLCFLSCSREEEKIIPELTDPDPLPVKISSFNGGNPLRIEYDSDNNIVSVSQSSYYNKLDVDSTRFFYKNELLDSVIKFKTWGFTIDTSTFTFLRDKNSRIIKIRQKSTVADYNGDYYIGWEGTKIVRFNCRAFLDSVLYDLTGNLTEVRTKRNYPYVFGNIFIDRLKVIGTINRPDPYSLIEQRLGYPFFRTDYYPGGLSFYTSLCINQYILGGKTYIWDYDYDHKGRISAKYLSKQPERR